MRLSVIIATKDRAEYLDRALESLGKQIGAPSFEVIVVDNGSVPRSSLRAAGGFDEQFHLYGWEDTDLGVRLRRAGLRSKFAWDAYLWHIKPASEVTLESEMRKALEKARMAVRFVRKDRS